jgi:hypothetical protein
MSQERDHHPLLIALRSPNDGLARQAAHLIGESQRFLEYTVSTFPGGTDHSSRHTTTVEQIAGMLLSDSFLAALSDHELFFLTVACHYHDLALAGTEADEGTTEAREQVRRDHAIRIGVIIRERWIELGFDDERTAQILGEICRGHRPNKNSEGKANWDDLNSVEVLGPNILVRVRLLSALTYAIDELHLGADRAPARVLNWRKISDEESRRHWRRHLAVNGPCPSPAGAILFQVNANTHALEENLRAKVFSKALAAIRDLRSQAYVDGVLVQLPMIEVHWDRRLAWEALLPLVCSDMQPRTHEDITQALLDRFAKMTSSGTNLASLCTERGSTEAELRAGASRSLKDAITFRHLIEAPGVPGGLCLSGKEVIADLLFERMRDRDELDRLFVGRYRTGWEEQLFGSTFGRGYVRSCVLPAVERSYSVLLLQRPETDPLRVILETCPTAARFVREYGPPPSNLVKDFLLTHAALTGALFDLHADPERLLDHRVRAAMEALARPDSSIAPTLRLLKELALVGGLTAEQVRVASTLSAAEQHAIKSITEHQEEILIAVTQTVPADAPAATSHLPRLLLASQRARTPILLTNVPGHVLNVQITPQDVLPEAVSDTFMLGVGPGGAQPIGPFRLPARLEVNRQSRTVRFYLGRFSTGSPTQYPVVLTLPGFRPPGEQPTGHFGATIQWPDLSVHDLQTLGAANQVMREANCKVEIVVERSSEIVAVMENLTGGELLRLGVFTSEVLRGLQGLDGNLPAPIFIPNQTIANLGDLTASDRNAAWQELRCRPSEEPRRYCSVFSRIATSTGTPIDEKFIKFFPFNLFPPPTIKEGGAMSNEEFVRRWAAGEDDFLLSGFFEADVFELSEALYAWCKAPSEEFPFRFESSGEPSPITRSLLSIRFPRVRDRIWHLDRPTIFEFRPVNRQEAYKLEAAYWRSVNDSRRAELAEEIAAQLEADTAPEQSRGQEGAT